MPLLTKRFPPLMLLCCPHQMLAVAGYHKRLWEMLGTGGEFHQTAKNLIISLISKISYKKSSSIKSVIPSRSNSNIPVIVLHMLHL